MNQLTSPFKFLDSYNQKDKDIFFGREKETEALYNALSGVKHLLVYGPSGSGKTSLVECGLRNQFSDADWFALTIRRGSNIAASVFDEINKVLKIKLDLHPETHLPKDPALDFGEALENLFTELYQPVYLLFDQFEELLISGTDNEKVDFFTRLNRLIRYKVPCRVMLIMREEFIGNLSEFEHLCPSIFQQRFRLEKMRKDSVREVIQKTLEAPKYNNAFKVEQSEQLVSAILSKLPDKRQEIELAHVQVFLDELWERAYKKKGENPFPIMNEELIKPNDNLEVMLINFLKNQLHQLESIYGKSSPLEVLAAMISERYTKLQLSEDDLIIDLANNDILLKNPMTDLLRELQQRRLIRSLISGDQIQYEISHDLLALAVGQNITEEMKLREKASEIYRVYEERKGYFSQEDLDLIRPYQSFKQYSINLGKRIKESEKHNAKLSKMELIKTRKWIGVLTIICLAAMFFGWTAFKNEQQTIRLTQQNKINDSLSRIEKFNRFWAEGQNFQSKGECSKAIDRFNISKEFSSDTVKINQAIIECYEYDKNILQFRILLKKAEQYINNKNYLTAINSYKESFKLNVGLNELREKLKDIKVILEKEKSNGKSILDAYLLIPNPSKDFIRDIRKRQINYKRLEDQLYEVNTLINKII